MNQINQINKTNQPLSISCNKWFVGVTACVFLVGLGFFWITSATSVRHLADNLIAAYLIAWGFFAFLSKLPRAEIVKGFILMTSTIAIVLLLFEGPALVGLLDYRQVFSTTDGFDPWDRPWYKADDELLWVHPPHYRSKGEFTRGNIGAALCLPHNAPQKFDLMYDQNGFRNDSDLAEADIVVIGDSFVESAILPSSAQMTSVLENLESARVANLGVAGYGPQQELIVLKRYAVNLHPKTIIWVFYEGNDLQEAQEFENKAAKFRKYRGQIQSYFHRSFMRNALSAVLKVSKECRPSADAEKRYGIVRSNQGEEHRIHFLFPLFDLSPRDIEALAMTKSALMEAYRVSRAHGIRFIVVFAPIKYRVYHGLPNLIEVSREVEKWVVNDLPERLRTILADISPDIEYVDLTSIFKSQVASGTSAFLPDDTHWGPAGSRIVAQACHKTLSGPIVSASGLH